MSSIHSDIGLGLSEALFLRTSPLGTAPSSNPLLACLDGKLILATSGVTAATLSSSGLFPSMGRLGFVDGGCCCLGGAAAVRDWRVGLKESGAVTHPSGEHQGIPWPGASLITNEKVWNLDTNSKVCWNYAFSTVWYSPGGYKISRSFWKKYPKH